MATDVEFAATVASLEGYLQQASQVSTSVTSAFDTYQRSVKSLDRNVDVLHRNLNGWRQAYDNVEASLQWLERLRGQCVDVPRQVQDVLMLGKEAPFEEFLDSYDKLVTARESVDGFLRKNNNLRAAVETKQRLTILTGTAERTMEEMFDETTQAGRLRIDTSRFTDADLKRGGATDVSLLTPDSIETLAALAQRLHGRTHHVETLVRELQSTLNTALGACFDRTYADEWRNVSWDKAIVGIYAMQSHGYIRALRVTRVLLTAAKVAANAVLPSHRSAYQEIVQPVMTHLLQEATALSSSAPGANRGGPCENRVLIHVDILLSSQQLHGAWGGLQVTTQMHTITSTLQKSALVLLDDYVECIRANDVKGSPDGVVHQLTTNTLHFIKRLCVDYPTILQALLATRPSAATQTAVVESFLHVVLENLEDSLKKKAARYPAAQKELAFIFLLNNYHYIHTNVTETPQLTAHIRTPRIDSLRANVQYYKDMYVKESWSKAIGILQENKVLVEEKLAKHGRQEHLSKGTKHILKNMFKAFFDELEARYHQQLHYNVPHDALRADLRAILGAQLVSELEAVVTAYGHLPFTSHPSKYIKYNTDTVRQMLDALFEGKLKR